MFPWASLVAQLEKNPPAMWETWVQSSGKIPWRRERLPISVLWPGEFHGLYSPWGRKESDTTEQLSLMAYSTKAGNCSVARSRCLENNLEFTQLALPLGIK